jgi:hypothetical protein
VFASFYNVKDELKVMNLCEIKEKFNYSGDFALEESVIIQGIYIFLEMGRNGLFRLLSKPDK